MRPALLIAWLLFTGLASVVTSPAQDAADLEGILNSGVQWAQENLADGILDQIQAPSQEEWQSFLAGVQQELQAGSIEELADWMPYVELGVRVLGRMKGEADTAAWLKQRLDYFEMASSAVQYAPDQGPAKRQTPALITGNRMLLKPGPRKRDTPVPAAIRLKRDTLISSSSLWRQKLKNRPAPVESRSLVPRLKTIFREEGVPSALVWIAEVESSMNPQARNPVGAAGLFQFMPATARRFDLRLWPVDERQHPEKSARAAARYLRFLYGEFNSWPLALAAYNAGEGRVQTVMETHKAKTFDAIAAHLPLETRMYVPKVSAVIALREGVANLSLPAPGNKLVTLGNHSEEEHHEALCWKQAS